MGKRLNRFSNSFKYLGSIFVREGGCKEDVKTRCLKASQVFYQLSPILGNKEITMTTKTQIIKAVFTPTLLYQSENWTLSSKERQMLTTTEKRCLRKAAGKTRMDKIRNEKIWRRVDATSRANSKQEQDQVVGTHQKDGTNGSPEQSTRDTSRRTTTEGKATKSLGG